MPLSLEEYRTKLINRILAATSKEEVSRYIATAMKALEKHKLNGHLISRFVDKISVELDLFNPLKNDSQQWSNIKIARIHFFRIKKELENTIC